MSSSADQSRDVSTWSTSTCSKSAAAASTVRPWVPEHDRVPDGGDVFARRPGVSEERVEVVHRRPAVDQLGTLLQDRAELAVDDLEPSCDTPA